MRIANAISFQSWQGNPAIARHGGRSLQIGGLTANPAFGPTAQIGTTLTAVATGGTASGWQWATLEAGDIAGATAPAFVPGPGLDGQTLFCRALVGGQQLTTAPRVVRHAPPQSMQLLSDVVLNAASGQQTIDVSVTFAGAALDYALVPGPLGAALSIDPASGIVTVDTDLAGPVAATPVTVSASNSGGTVAASFQLAISAAAAAPVVATAPAIAGTAEIGATLVVDSGTWIGDTPMSFAFEWRRGGVPIAGASQPSYVPVAADDGQPVDCAVTASNAAGSAVATAPARVITYPAPLAVGTPADATLTEGSGPQSLDLATAFSGAALVYSLAANPAAAAISIDGASGVVTIDTDATGPLAGATLTVQAANSGGAAQQSLALTVAPAAGQSVTFGQRTAAGAGGIDIGASAILSGDPQGHWQIVGGRLSPSGAGAAAGLPAGPYTLATDSGTVTVSIVPGVRSVASMAELEAALEDPGLAYGDVIACRDGDFGDGASQTAVGRGSAAAGTYSPANSVRIEAEAGARPVLRNLALGSNCHGFEFVGLTFSTRRHPAASHTGAVNVTVANTDLTFRDCAFVYGATLLGTETDVLTGIYAPSTLNCHRMRLIGNRFDGVFNALSSLRGDDCEIVGNEIRNAQEDDIQNNRGARRIIRGNLLTDKSEKLDVANVVDIRSNGAGGTIIEVDAPLPTGAAIENAVLVGAGLPAIEYLNFSYTKDFTRTANNANLVAGGSGSINLTTVAYPGGWVSGGRLYWKRTHADAIQIYTNSAAAGDFDGWVIEGNRILTGQSPAQLGFNNRQGGIFGNGSGMGAFAKTNWKVRGNLIEIPGRNGIALQNLQNAEVWSNVVITRLGYDEANSIDGARITVGGNGTAYDNISSTGSSYGALTTANNVTVDEDAPSDYAAEFAAAPAGNGRWTGPDYDYAAYLPAPTATPLAGLAGWDFVTGSYTGTR